ncbi:acid phosphatase 1 [Vitis vinifera]|uniref:Acid phosphatase 1 n=1 Tax=Vitis vinifera TaxID=29760 RepID=F6HY80_VITVI|nr:acid phosphatase 1 [Vitis vinifera]|eukprot:XP_010654600.1 PREDICTED: acid phosphatase 1-like [Vitis vinifera]
MGGVLVIWLLLFAGAVELSLGISHEIHLLRPQLGSSGHHVPGLSCLSWRLGVEAHNIIEWSTVPQACESYVGHYMLGHQYRKDSRAVVYEALTYAQSLKLAVDGKDIWVFDVDETSPSNLPYYAKHGFRVEAYNSTQFNNWVYEGKAPALPESLKLYKKLLSLGIKAVFITGRPEAQRNVTAANLRNVGYHTWEKLILKGSSAGTIVVYKSNERKKLKKSGYRIIDNIGDQWSDILGTNTENRTFKLSNPMYYIS